MLLLFLSGCKGANIESRVSKSDKELNCMLQIFAADDSLGSIRNHDPEKIELGVSIERYTSALNQLDFTNCPNDFQEAYQKHIFAWMKMTRVAHRFPDLRGEMHDLFDEIEESEMQDQFKPLLKEIWDTWAVIEQVYEPYKTESK